jgi:hypothetical protein
MADNTLKEAYDAEKAQVENLVDYEEELRTKSEDKLKEQRDKSYKDTAEKFKEAYEAKTLATEEKAAAIRAKSAEESAEKMAALAAAYKKKDKALQDKIDKEKDDNKKKKLEDQQKKEKEKYAKELKQINAKFQKESANAEKLAEKQEKAEAKAEKAKKVNNTLGSGAVGGIANLLTGNITAGLSQLSGALGSFATSLKSSIESIQNAQAGVDTRLQGSKNATKSGSYWQQMTKDIASAAAISPYVKQEDLASKMQSMVSSGIAYNVEQRAFLYTISDKIATTFESTNGTLAQLVRIQQQDSTAARLGMESALNQFLNNMYETTEYMTEVMSNIRSSLYEAEALMSKEAATEFDYSVNKWLGSLYSVGMSSSAVQSIGDALGKLASGQISGITSDGTGNLIVMAASNAGLSVSDMLQSGLDESKTNQLMTAMVKYLKGIYEDTGDSLVVAQQYASVFGLAASDLKAMSNLSSVDIANTAGSNLSYDGMMTQLSDMMDTMYQRVGAGQLLSNAMSNFKYSLASGIATSPILYSIYMLGDVLDSVANGIKFSIPTVMGTGMAAQEFKVSDIIKTTSMAGSLIAGIANLVSSGSSGGTTGQSLLKAFGVSGNGASVARGNGSGLITSSGSTVSSSGYVGNSSAGDVYNKSLADTQDDANSQTVEATDDSTEATNTDINNSVIQIYQLLQSVTDGSMSLKVDMGDSSSWSQAMSSARL